MNDARRKVIAEALMDLQSAKDKIEGVKDEEQDSFDNMPEGLQQGDKGQAMEEAINYLEEAAGNIESAMDDLGNIQ